VEVVREARAGTYVAGRYQLDGRLDDLDPGGMGEVWRAFDPRLERPVAVKFPLLTGAENPQARQDAVSRFLREAGVTGRLCHAGVPAVYDAGEEDGRYFIVMELIQGLSLRTFMMENGPLDPSVVAAVGVRVCDLLSTAHELGVVHRDLKPTNVMVSYDGAVKVLDFGIAAVAEIEATRLTRTGQQIGSAPYMAPEQIQEGHGISAQTDLYSLGCVLYEMLTGRPPFPGPGPFDLHLQHVSVTPDPVERWCPDVPRGISDLLRRLLAKDPSDRPGTAADVNRALRPFLPAPSSPAPKPMLLPDPTRPFRFPFAPPESPRGGRPSARDHRSAAEGAPFVDRQQVRRIRHTAQDLRAEGQHEEAALLLGNLLPQAALAFGERAPDVLDVRVEHAHALEAALRRSDAHAVFRNIAETVRGIPGLEIYARLAAEGTAGTS
jgi:eukaryotic-like serine/threonine-protein kinase